MATPCDSWPTELGIMLRKGHEVLLGLNRAGGPSGTPWQCSVGQVGLRMKAATSQTSLRCTLLSFEVSLCPILEGIAAPSGVQGLFMGLFSVITSDGAQDTTWDAGD